MFALEVGSWIILGFVLGSASVYFSSTRAVSVPEAGIFGGFGGLLGGLAFRGLIPGGAYSGLALLMSVVSAILLLMIDWSAASSEDRGQRSGFWKP